MYVVYYFLIFINYHSFLIICKEFTKAGVDLNKPIIATCGSGVTACWISFAASLLGKEIPVYDVSHYPLLFELNLLDFSVLKTTTCNINPWCLLSRCYKIMGKWSNVGNSRTSIHCYQ